MIAPKNEELDRMLAEARPRIAKHWMACREAGLTGHVGDATDRVDARIARYFANLKSLPESAPKHMILKEMQSLYADLSLINRGSGGGLLETDERELLVPIFVAAAEATGIDPRDCPDGEPGSEYRDF